MKTEGVKLKGGYRAVIDKNGNSRIEKIPGYGLDASAKIRQRKSKKVKVKKP